MRIIRRGKYGSMRRRQSTFENKKLFVLRKEINCFEKADEKKSKVKIISRYNKD